MSRIVGLILLMFVVFWATSTWLLAFGADTTLRDVQFALALSVFFGSISAVPAIVYLLCAVLYAATIHLVIGMPLPQASESWHLYKQRYVPLLLMASVPLVFRVARAFRSPTQAK